MAVVKWRGDAPGVAQVDVRTIGGTAAAGSYFEAACNGKTLRYTVPSTVVSGFLQDLIDGFLALWTANASQENGIGEFNEATCEQYDTAKLAFTSTVPGQPFTFTYSCGGGVTGPTTDSTNSVASSGPKDASVVANYSTGALPSASDELWFDDASNGPEFGLTALSAIALSKVVFTENFSGNVGRAPRVEVGRTTYIEYRAQYLQLKPENSSATILVDCVSQLMRLDCQTFQTNLQVINTSQVSGNVGAPILCFKGSHASNAVIVDRGSVGLAYYPGETCVVSTLRMGYVDQIDTDAQVVIGLGCTLGTVTMTGGNLNSSIGLTTLNQRAGSTTIKGTITTATIYAGRFSYVGSGTITTLTIHRDAEAYFNESNQARTVTNTTVYPSATWQDPGATVTHTNAISVPGGSPTQIVGTFGVGRSSNLSFAA